MICWVPQGDFHGLFRGQREGFVQRVGMQRLRSAKDRRERLKRHPHDVVVRLLGRQRAAGGLGMKAQGQGVWIRRMESFLRLPCAHRRRAARYLAISSKKSLWALKKDSRGAKSSTFIPASMADFM